MKTKMRGLTLAAALLSASPSVMAGSNDSAYGGNDRATPTATVGDLPGYGEDAYFAESASYAEASRATTSRTNPAPAPVFDPSANESAMTVGDVPARTRSTMPGQYRPVSFGSLQPETYVDAGIVAGGCDGSCGSISCDGSCDSGCDSGRPMGSITQALRGGKHGGWATAEALLWFPQARQSPPLAITSAPGVIPVLPTANVAFGNPIGGGLSGGFRTDFGTYLTRGVGIGGRFWILGDNGDSFTAAGNGSDQSIGVPFFNTTTNAEDSVLVASTTAGLTGALHAKSSLSMLAAEAYGRFSINQGRDFHVDLIGGYTHFDIDDSLNLTLGNVNALGTARTFHDSFDMENQFNGGQIGFESFVSRGRWTFRSLTKMHLGNMNQQVRIQGMRTNQILGGPVATYDRGLFALGDQGTYERDVFTFAPELNLKLAYRFRPHVQLSVGYSFIYWDNLALSGSYVNRNIDQDAVVNNNATLPQTFHFVDSSLWVQGIDLGAIINF